MNPTPLIQLRQVTKMYGAGNGDALLLAAREFGGGVVFPPSQANRGQGFSRHRMACFSRLAPVQQG